MYLVRIWTVFFLLFFALSSLAADLSGISNIFKATYWTSHYEERYCGKNIEKLVRKAMEKNLDLDGAQIVEITDVGGWMFGMVNALNAREGGRLIQPAQTSPARLPGEKNWYHHVVLLVNGKVLDYDFMNQPTIVPVKDYFNQMFVPADRVGDSKYKQSKMKLYKLALFPAEDYILRQNSRLSTREISTEKYLKDFLPDFF